MDEQPPGAGEAWFTFRVQFTELDTRHADQDAAVAWVDTVLRETVNTVAVWGERAPWWHYTVVARLREVGHDEAEACDELRGWLAAAGLQPDAVWAEDGAETE